LNKEAKIGEVVAGINDDILIASGIGSCVVVTLYDVQRKVGTLAHTMLPGTSTDNDAKYVGTAIDIMLEQMQGYGVKKETIAAKLVGGANMFAAFKSDVGQDNINSAKERLKKEGIHVVGEATGGTQGRSVEFVVASGVVTVKVKF